MLGESYSRFFFGDDLQKLLLPGSAPYGLQQIIGSEQVVPCRSFRHGHGLMATTVPAG